MPKADFPALDDLIDKVHSAASLNDALAEIAASLHQAGFSPTACGLAVVEADGTFGARGMWNAGPSTLQIGDKISADLTSDARAIADRLLAGRPVWFRTRDVDLGMLGDIFRKEAGSVWVIIPLSPGTGGVPGGVVAVASSDPDIFKRMDVVLFEGLVRGTEDALLAKDHDGKTQA